MHQLLPHVAKKITDIPQNVIDLYKEIAEMPRSEGMPAFVKSALGWVATQGVGKFVVNAAPNLAPWVMAFNIVNAVRSPWAKDLWDVAKQGHGKDAVSEILDAPVSQVLINEAAALAEAERRAALPSAPTPQGDPDYDENGGDDNGGPSPSGPPVSQVLISEAEASAAEAAAAEAAAAEAAAAEAATTAAATTAADVEEWEGGAPPVEEEDNDNDNDTDTDTDTDVAQAEAQAEAEETERMIEDEGVTWEWGEADGGLIKRLDKELPRPTEPDVADDLQRMLSEGEFVIPVNVVEHFGVKFFTDLISVVPPPEKKREIGLKSKI